MRIAREKGVTLPEVIVVAALVAGLTLLWILSPHNLPLQTSAQSTYNSMLSRAHDQAALNDGMTLAFTPTTITLYRGRPNVWPLTQEYSVALPPGEVIKLVAGGTTSTSFGIIVDPAGTIAPVPSWSGAVVATEPACVDPVQITFSDGPGSGDPKTISCIDARFN